PPTQGGHLDLPAQSRCVEGDRQLAVQIVAITLENLVWFEANLDVEVARWPPLTPGSPFPEERMRMPSSMPAGIFTCRVLFLRMRPTPSQATHGSGTTFPLPWQVGHVC